MPWYFILSIIYFGLNLILAIFAMLIGFGYASIGQLALLFLKVLFFGLPIIAYQAIVEWVG